MIYEPWDIVAVPFPFTDRNVQKKRPALVLTNSVYQEQHGHCILAMITSAKQSSWSTDIMIEDLDSAGLKSPSLVRTKLFTLDDRLILRQVGELSKFDQKKVAKVLQHMFAF